MSILPQIVEWSSERPLWQQDALRRLVEQPTLTAKDLDELASLCKVEHGIAVSGVPTAKPLAGGETPDVPLGGAPTVCLTGVHRLQGVNALQPNQALRISPHGITVVYGENGAGKSGYVRVLKQVCRARGTRDTVHPNVYADDAVPASAVVAYEVLESAPATPAAPGDGASPPSPDVRQVDWSLGVTGSAELTQVSVFDSRSAAVYVTKENEVAYLPHGTDLFPKLAEACTQVKTRLDAEIAQLENAQDKFESIPPDTAAYELVRTLSLAKARQRFDVLATLSDAERSRLQELRLEDQRYRAENPMVRAMERRQCVSRLSAARKRLAALESTLDHSAINTLGEAHAALTTARAAAALASGEAFAAAPIGGVGGETWRALWEAARRFAQHGATPPQTFPPADDAPEDTVCVLCQQTLGEPARSRMLGFEEFIQTETRGAVDRATRELTARIDALAAIAPHTLADATLLEEIKSLDEELGNILAECMTDLVRRREDALAAVRADALGLDWTAFAHAPTGAHERLLALESAVAEEATQYETGTDPEVRKTTVNALRELEARLALDDVRDRAYAEIERQALRVRLRDAVKSTNTATITKHATEVLRQAVSEPLALEFAREVAALSLGHLPIAVNASHGQKGRTLHVLSLGTTDSSKVPTEEVLSEGEHRCTALAAFLAEVSLQESASTVVFDDPVSSLDHARRSYVAHRITTISQTRPVLVFTHDLVFLWMLHSAAEAANAPLVPRYFRRDALGAGLITDEWPWDGLNVKGRAGQLKQSLVLLKKLAATDRPTYEGEVRVFYGKLRETWERSVEEIVFNQVVRRFNPEVQTLRLRNVHRITKAQVATLFAGMKKSSQWLQGHDHAAELALPIPEHDEVSLDFTTFEQWLAEMRAQNTMDD